MMVVPVWDLLVFLGCMQIFLLMNIRYSGSERILSALSNNRSLFTAFTVSVAVFWLVWGGYSIDAWRYLARFDFSAVSFREEQLFWFAGQGLSYLLPDPWPIKVISSISVTIIAFSYYRYFEENQTLLLNLTYILLLLTPGFFLLNGNAIRQGLGASIGLLAAIYFLSGSYGRWLALTVVGFLVHQSVLLIAFALLMARLLRSRLSLVWICSFFFGPAIVYLFSSLGVNPGDFIRYADYSEGAYHWEKALVTWSLSAFVVYSLHRNPQPDLDFRHAYVSMVIVSNLFLVYEVPFERILLFTDLFAAPALAQVLIQFKWINLQSISFTAVIAVGSLVLWSHQSIMHALGYA